MKSLLALLLSLLVFPVTAQITLTINGQPVTSGSVVITTTTTVVTPPPPPPPPPVLVSGYTVLTPIAIKWPAGNSYLTVGAPLLHQLTKTIQPYVIAVDALIPGATASIQLYSNSRNLKVNISDTQGDMGTVSGVSPFFVAASGKDGISFVVHGSAITDSTLMQYGYKRIPPLPAGQAYINVQADGPGEYFLLYY